MDDAAFKLLTDRLDAIDGKLEGIEKSHIELDKSFVIFKVKAYMFIAILVGAKEVIVKKFLL